MDFRRENPRHQGRCRVFFQWEGTTHPSEIRHANLVVQTRKVDPYKWLAANYTRSHFQSGIPPEYLNC